MTMPVAKRILRISRRLHELVLRNDILQSQGQYRLDPGLVQIEGSVTVVKSRARAFPAGSIIRLRHDKIDAPIMPDIVGFSRWLYGKRESGFPSCVLYNYSLTSDTTFTQVFTEEGAAARNWLDSRAYPNPGEHCKTCLRPCQGLRA
jgi:hypothetical protein